MANTVTMYLKYQKGDLYYSLDDTNFRPLEEDTVTGVNAGDEVFFRLTADSGIRKINNIQVNIEKSHPRNWKDIWAEKPKAFNKTSTIFRGVIKSGLDDVPKYNGYTINYKTDQGDKEKDPDVLQPPPDGEGGNG